MRAFDQHLVVCANAQVWDADDSRLAPAFHLNSSGMKLIRYGVTRLGWIELRVSDGFIRIACRPSLVSELGLAQMLFELFDRPRERYAVSLLGGSWCHFVLRCPGQVSDLLATLVTQKDARLDAPRFLRADLPGTQSPLAEQVREALAVLGAGTFCFEELAKVNRIFRGRWSISHFEDQPGHMAFDFMGQSFTRLGPDWSGGHTFNPPSVQLVDKSYHNWVGAFRETAAAKREPVFDIVDATVTSAYGDIARLRYHRVTAAFSTKHGRRYVLSGSMPDLAINLRKAV